MPFSANGCFHQRSPERRQRVALPPTNLSGCLGFSRSTANVLALVAIFTAIIEQ